MSKGGIASLMLGGPLTVGLLLGVAISVGLLISMCISNRVGAKVGCALATFQGYAIAVGGFYPSLAMLAWLSTWRSIFTNPGFWRWRWPQAVLALLCVEFLSIAWSPDKMLGVRDIIYSVPILFAGAAAYQISAKDPAFLQRCIALLVVGSAAEAFLVIVFRVLPSVESRFLHSAVARIFISGNVLDVLFIEGTKNNVLDPAKAGGVFVNANIASVFLGVCAIVAWQSGKDHASALLKAVAIFDWVAVFFTGSKAGAALAVAVPLALTLIRTRRLSHQFIITASLSCGIGAVGLVLLWDVLNRYQHASADTLATHLIIWHFAAVMVHEHPLLGLGFGGWDLHFPFYAANHGISKNYPPHNSLLIAWSQSGIAAVITGLWWMSTVYAAAFRGFRLGDRERALGVCLAGAFTWYLGEGFGENMGLLGEVHLTPMMGVLLGHLCARCDARETVNERIPETTRGTAPASAIPAV